MNKNFIKSFQNYQNKCILHTDSLILKENIYVIYIKKQIAHILLGHKNSCQYLKKKKKVSDM